MEIIMTMRLTEIQAAYLAGFFDADGAIMACIENHVEKKFGFRVRLSIKIAQKSRALLDQFQKELGWGYVRLNRTVYEYDIRDQRQIAEFIEMIYPYSRAKKAQLELAREITSRSKCISDKKHLVKVAQLADCLASYNVRSSGSRKNFAAAMGYELTDSLMQPTTLTG